MLWYKFPIGQFLTDTVDLSPAEEGIYLRLMNWYYSNESPIPGKRAYSIVRAKSRLDRERTDFVLRRFFFERDLSEQNSCTDFVWMNPAIESAIQNSKKKAKAARANGKLGGRPKKNPPESAGTVAGIPNPTHIPEITEEVSISESAPPASTSSRTPARDNDFDVLWRAYPMDRRKEKPAAKREWDQGCRSEGGIPGINRLLVSLAVQKRSRAWTENDGQPIPTLAEWLAKRQWERGSDE